MLLQRRMSALGFRGLPPAVRGKLKTLLDVRYLLGN